MPPRLLPDSPDYSRQAWTGGLDESQRDSPPWFPKSTCCSTDKRNRWSSNSASSQGSRRALTTETVAFGVVRVVSRATVRRGSTTVSLPLPPARCAVPGERRLPIRKTHADQAPAVRRTEQSDLGMRRGRHRTAVAALRPPNHRLAWLHHRVRINANVMLGLSARPVVHWPRHSGRKCFIPSASMR
jgi:hypothetical protein